METVFQNMGTYKYRRNKMIIQNKSRTSCKFRVTTSQTFERSLMNYSYYLIFTPL